MGAIGVITTLMEFGLFFMIIRIGFLKSTVPAFLATTTILAGIQFFTFLRLPTELPDREYECELDDGNITIRLNEREILCASLWSCAGVSARCWAAAR